jgi:hypothetical protein
MASDVHDIVKRQKERMQKQDNNRKTTGIMRSKESRGMNAPRQKVSIDNVEKNFIIATDHEGKPLKGIGPAQK